MDWGAVGGIGTIVGALIGLAIYVHQHWHRKVEAQVADPEYRARLIERHACRAAAGYYLSLDRLLGWAERVYGRPLGWRAFSLSLLLAYFYPLLAALIGWMVANQTAPGGLTLFPDTSDLGARLWQGSVIVAMMLGIFWFFRRADAWSKKLADILRKKLDTANHRSGFLAKADRWLPDLAETLAYVGAVAFAVAVGVAFAFAGAVGVGVAFAVGVAAAGAVAFAVAVGVAAAGAVAGVIPIETAALTIFLYAVLPLANATADWLSLAVTRGLLQDMAKRRPGAWGLAAHLVFDLIAGVVCLALLLAALVGPLSLWATIHPASLPFDWRAYWATARADPIQGIALWLMCFTTLLPTLVHAVFSLTLWQTQKSEHTRAAVVMMRGMGDTAPEAARIDVARLILRGRLSGFGRALIFWTPPLLILAWIVLRVISS